MLQKETQHWEATPDFVDAINSVMEGDAAVKSTKVVVLSAVTDLPFAEVKASGNGFTVERKFYRIGAGPSARMILPECLKRPLSACLLKRLWARRE